jgi:putative nucleotidyltransferase with HDIG domain
LPVTEVREQEIQWLSMMHFIDIGQLNGMMVIPLMNRDEMLGMIIGIYLTEGRAPMRFSERYYAAVRGIGNQVSTALEQAKLYRESVEKTMELAHRIEVINTMYEIDRSILSSLTSADILSTVTRMAGKLLPCDVAAIMLVDTEKKGFNRIASSGLPGKELAPFFLFRDTSAADVIRNGRPQYIPNLSEVRDLKLFESGLLHNDLMSVMRIPLTIGDTVEGFLSFYARRASAFTREDLLTAERLGSQISVALANARLISDLEESSMATIKSLSNAIDAKSKWTAGHSEGVARYAQAIGKALGLDRRELGDLEVASMLHDIGKIGTYAYILDKQEKLADEEWSLIKEHPDKGVEILSPIKQLQHIIPVIRHHHEYFDGTGYPGGLRGEEIPLLARILSVADAVDAMSYDRPYRKHMGKDEIIRELNRCSGTQFDPRIVQVFLSVQNILDR